MTTAMLDDELDMDLDTSGFGPEDAKPSTSGGACDKAGHYHVVCNGIKKEGGDNKTPCLRLDLQILAGEHDDQIGKMIFHRVYTAKAKRSKEGQFEGLEPLTEGGKRMLLRCAAGFGLISPEDVGSGSVRIPWSQIEMRQAIVQVSAEDRTDMKTGQVTGKDFKISFGNIWPIGHEDVANVPTDAEALAQLTGGAGVGGANVDDI